MRCEFGVVDSVLMGVRMAFVEWFWFEDNTFARLSQCRRTSVYILFVI